LIVSVFVLAGDVWGTSAYINRQKRCFSNIDIKEKAGNDFFTARALIVE